MQVVILLLLALLPSLATAAPAPRPTEVDTETKSDVVQELLKAQGASKDGVLHWDVSQFDKYAIGKKRPFTVMFFFTAKHLLSKSNLGLKKLRVEFGYLSKAAIKKTDANGQVFFVEVEYSESEELFRRFGVNSLPYIFRLAPNVAVGRDGTIKLKHDDVMRHEAYGHEHWSADDMAAFLRDKTGLDVGKVEKPNAAQNPLFPLLALGVVATLSFVAWKVYNAEFMKYLWIWVLGVLVVYWFSVSGGMHNIIRGVPFVYVDQQGKPQLFMGSGQGQLGAEGFMMGSLYTMFGLSFTGLTYLGPKIKDVRTQRLVCYAMLLLGISAYFQLIKTHRWKVGHSWSTYIF